jgi:hypothetical protein
VIAFSLNDDEVKKLNVSKSFLTDQGKALLETSLKRIEVSLKLIMSF